MRALVQRVVEASVLVEGQEVGRIGPGLVVFLGFAGDDEESDSLYLVEKTVNLRIFCTPTPARAAGRISTGPPGPSRHEKHTRRRWRCFAIPD